MWRGLAHAIENALARAFGRSVSQAISDWWGWAPLAWALLAAVVAFLALRAFRVRRERLLTGLVAIVVFVGAAVWLPAVAWVSEQAVRSTATEAVRDALIDPASGQLSDVTLRRLDMGDSIVCGRVNAKARNGAYQGPQLFAVIVTPRRDVRMLSVDSACYGASIRSPLHTRERCETTIRSDLDMLAGSAHRICEGD